MYSYHPSFIEDLLEPVTLEEIASEFAFQSETMHDDIKADHYLQQLIPSAKQILRNYGYVWDSAALDFLKKTACEYSPYLRMTFIEFLTRKIMEDYGKVPVDHDIKHTETLQAEAFKGAGFRAFYRRGFTSNVENLGVAYAYGSQKDTQPDDISDDDVINQTDDEISSLIDSILFG